VFVEENGKSQRCANFLKPKQIKEIKDFLRKARQGDASKVTIYKKSAESRKMKFKLRTKKYLYTLVLKDQEKASRLKQSLPPNLPITELAGAKKKEQK
jgi:large subunit ribosomal protein L38e